MEFISGMNKATRRDAHCRETRNYFLRKQKIISAESVREEKCTIFPNGPKKAKEFGNCLDRFNERFDRSIAFEST